MDQVERACDSLLVSGLNYSQNIGCAASKDPGPGQCDGVETFAVPHRYPRTGWTRLYVCEHHARDHATAEPLTEEDRRTIAARRARRDALLARVTVGPYARRSTERMTRHAIG